tara:strand:+ start:547 stop:1332 length:786 start_codon:yes stop_codon:yes gene_type:complete
MPIVNAFDEPQGGANGGFTPGDSGGGGGVNLDAVPLAAIDLTDGTWTLEDPDNLVNTVNHSSGVNTIVWNALGVASSDYRWTSSTTCRAPRWYKLLTVNGVQMKESDFMALYFKLKLEANYDFPQEVVLGTCSFPTATLNSTSTSAILGSGALVQSTSGGFASRFAGAWSLNSGGTVSGASTDFVHIAQQRGAGAIGGPAGYIYDSTPAGTSAISRNTNKDGLSNNNLYWIVGAGTRGNQTISAGDETQFQGKYLAIGVTI